MKTRIICTTLILLIDRWKNPVRPIKSAYLSVTWLFFDKRLQIKDKHLVVRPKQKVVSDSEIKILVLKTPSSRLVHMLDWLLTVMLLLSDFETNNLRK